MQKSRTVKMVLKRDKVGGLALSDFRATIINYYKD